MNRTVPLICFIGTIFSCLSAVSGSPYVPNFGRRPKIIGGQVTQPNRFPYLVSVYHTNRRHNCMGGILNDRYILTAAHCIVNPETDKFFNIPMEIVIDTVDFVKIPGNRIKVEKGYVSTAYVEPGYYNDIGILKLSESLDLSTNSQRQKLDLPKVGVDYVGRNGTIAGFGIGKILRHWRTKVISDEECQKKWWEITENYLCAQMVPRPDGSAVGICNGDSGSPLVIDNTVVGVAIVAEDDCDERLKPALYVNVSQHLHFIETVLSGQLNDITEYNFPSRR